MPILKDAAILTESGPKQISGLVGENIVLFGFDENKNRVAARNSSLVRKDTKKYIMCIETDKGVFKVSIHTQVQLDSGEWLSAARIHRGDVLRACSVSNDSVELLDGQRGTQTFYDAFLHDLLDTGEVRALETKEPTPPHVVENCAYVGREDTYSVVSEPDTNYLLFPNVQKGPDKVGIFVRE
jgi:hypothetical protein